MFGGIAFTEHAVVPLVLIAELLFAERQHQSATENHVTLRALVPGNLAPCKNARGLEDCECLCRFSVPAESAGQLPLWRLETLHTVHELPLGGNLVAKQFLLNLPQRGLHISNKVGCWSSGTHVGLLAAQHRATDDSLQSPHNRPHCTTSTATSGSNHTNPVKAFLCALITVNTLARSHHS